MDKIVPITAAVVMGLAACTAGSHREVKGTEAAMSAPIDGLGPLDRESRCSSTASPFVNGEPRRVRMEVSPCSVSFGDTPRTRLINVGRTEVGYGPGFKLERKVNGRWQWINRRQVFPLPLFYLEPGEKGKLEPLALNYLESPNPLELEPGVYRAAKGLQLTPGQPRPPTMSIRVNFRVLNPTPARIHRP